MTSEALHFMRTKLTAVVGWNSLQGRPQAATVFVWIQDVGDNDFKVYFVTRRHTRKFVGIQNDPRVAVVIGTEFEPRSVQIEGDAKLLSSSDDFATFMKSLDRFEAPPTQSLLYANSFFQGETRGSDYAIFEVTPTWARYMDYNREKHDAVYTQLVGEDRQDGDTGAVTPKRKKGARKSKAVRRTR